jgi:hypothetical protein
MNEIEAGHSLTPCRDTQTAPATVYGRQESDESYEGVISREGDLRIVNCPDDIQWIAQRLTGGRWRNKSFHRIRRSLIQRYGPLEMILALPEHHDGFIEVTPRCELCGRIKSKPAAGLPRHMFCIAVRKARNGPGVGVAGPLPNRRLRSGEKTAARSQSVF